jgi:hypothetical protein
MKMMISILYHIYRTCSRNIILRGLLGRKRGERLINGGEGEQISQLVNKLKKHDEFDSDGISDDSMDTDDAGDDET